jgi:hypothetical protein
MGLCRDVCSRLRGRQTLVLMENGWPYAASAVSSRETRADIMNRRKHAAIGRRLTYFTSKVIEKLK